MKLINKKELTTWSIAIAIFILVAVSWMAFGNTKTGVSEQSPDEVLDASYLFAPQARMAANEKPMSGSAFLVRPAVVSICTLGIDLPGGYHLEGIGSGTIINSQGFILTSYSVVKNKKDLKIVIFEPSRFEGQVLEQGHNHIYDTRVISVFPASGLAVLKIESYGLPYARFGNSNQVQMGEWCLAIGNPMGRKAVVTSGIINSLNQSKKVNKIKCNNLIEMSCKGDRSVRGGPLVNKRGEIIGTIVIKGYAVPSSRAMDLLAGMEIPLM
jgi:S1-C subfamily serine protease